MEKVCVRVCAHDTSPCGTESIFRGSRTLGDILNPGYWRVAWASIDFFRACARAHAHTHSYKEVQPSRGCFMFHAFVVWPVTAESTIKKTPTKSMSSCVFVAADFQARCVFHSAACSPQTYTEKYTAATIKQTIGTKAVKNKNKKISCSSFTDQ